MRDLIPIDAALKLLTLFRKQRMTAEERDRIDLAIYQLGLAQVDPEYRAYLHTPIESRGSHDPSSVSNAGTNHRGGRE